MGKKEDQNSPVDEREAGGEEGWQKEGKPGAKRWKETEYNTQREAWSSGKDMQMLIGSAMKNLLMKLCFIWAQSSF